MHEIKGLKMTLNIKITFKIFLTNFLKFVPNKY